MPYHCKDVVHGVLTTHNGVTKNVVNQNGEDNIHKPSNLNRCHPVCIQTTPTAAESTILVLELRSPVATTYCRAT
jgi:hypothetical protein